MSAEPPNPSGSPGRSRPHLSDLSRETTEEDLWNLDDEAPAQAVQPRQPKPAPTGPAAKEPVHTLEPTGAEPPMPRGLTAPAKPLTPRTTPASGPDEFGELDDEDEDLPVSAPVSESKAPPQDEVVTLTSPIDDEPPLPPAAKVTKAPKEPEAPVKKTPQEVIPAPEQPALRDEFEPHDEELLGKTSARENRQRGATPVAKANLRPRLNRREVIGIATFAVVAMIASVWMLTRFFTLLSFTHDSDGRPDYPLKGELVQIASGSTFWREPVRTGDNRDVARREVVMIPVLELALDPAKSGGGSLRVIFRNADGEPVGDPITRSFGAGHFEGSGSANSSFAATDGFNAEGDFQAYRTGKGKLWTADVLEGPPGGTPASAFKKISSIPIFPERR